MRPKATIVLDTSAVLAGLGLIEALYAAARAYGVELLLPVTTLGELDRIKDREKFSARGVDARRAINWINRTLTAEDVDSPVLRAQRQAETLVPGLRADDAILDCCLYNAQHRQTLTILMSDDRNLRSRALAERLDTLDTQGMSAREILDAIRERTVGYMDLDGSFEESTDFAPQGFATAPAPPESVVLEARGAAQDDAGAKDMALDDVMDDVPIESSDGAAQGPPSTVSNTEIQVPNASSNGPISASSRPAVNAAVSAAVSAADPAQHPSPNSRRAPAEGAAAHTEAETKKTPVRLESRWSALPSKPEPRSSKPESRSSKRASRSNKAAARPSKPEIPFPPVRTSDTTETLVQNVAALTDWYVRRDNAAEDLELLGYARPEGYRAVIKLVKTYFVPVFRYVVSRSTFELAEKTARSGPSPAFVAAWGRLLVELAQHNDAYVRLVDDLAVTRDS